MYQLSSERRDRCTMRATAIRPAVAARANRPPNDSLFFHPPRPATRHLESALREPSAMLLLRHPPRPLAPAAPGDSVSAAPVLAAEHTGGATCDTGYLGVQRRHGRKIAVSSGDRHRLAHYEDRRRGLSLIGVAITAPRAAPATRDVRREASSLATSTYSRLAPTPRRRQSSGALGTRQRRRMG